MAFSSALLALLPLTFTTPIPQPLPAPESGVKWLEMALPEALALASEKDKLVMVQLVTEWERECGRLSKTLANEEVVKELRGVLCLTIDAETGEGSMLAYQHRVGTYPTLLFMNGAGELVDRLRGYRSAALMVAGLQRIERGEFTIKSMRDGVNAAPDNLDLRYDLARKLEIAGDPVAAAAEYAEIKQRDPDGTSTASLRLGFDKIHDTFYDQLYKWEEPDWDGLVQAIEAVDDPFLKFKGKSMLAFAHDVEGVRARNKKEFEDVQPHMEQSRALYLESWDLVPEESVGVFGNELAYNFFQDAEYLSEDEKEFALKAAKVASRALPEDTSVMDTLACCYFMNGDPKEALRLIKRCRKLDPARAAQWDKRDKEFTAAPKEDGEAGGAGKEGKEGGKQSKAKKRSGKIKRQKGEPEHPNR